MRRITKKNGQDSCLETAGYEMSIGDLMAGLLYIFIIILMVFVLSYQVQTKRALDELKSSKELRNEMLQEIKEMLDASHIEVEVDMEHGIIHLTENAIHFESARSDLDNSEQAKLAKIATVLVKVLPRFAAPLDNSATDARYSGKLESVFIEGHTDNVPYRNSGQFRDNWELSAFRAIYIYRQLTAYQPALGKLQNNETLPLFSISGYGESRPREGHRHQTPKPDPANRRIDLRVIMSPPKGENPIVQQLQKQL